MKRRISKSECMLTETSQTEMKHKGKKRRGTEYQRTVVLYNYDKKAHNENTRNGRKNEKKKEEEIVEALMFENFPKLMTDTNHISRKLRGYQVAYSQKSTPIIMHTIFKLQKNKEKLLEEQRGKNRLYA